MNKGRKGISQNSQVGELTGHIDVNSHVNNILNIEDFSYPNTNGKNELKPIIKQLVRETNRLKLNYAQLKYIFKAVRDQCQVEVTGSTSRKLYELPNTDELRRFYAVIEDPVHRLIFETLELTGLRVSELCNLEVARLDLKNNLGFVSEGKGKKDRIIVIPNRLTEKINIYLDGKKNRYLFESNRHTKYSRRRIAQLCVLYRSKAEISKRISAHVFRHVWNTRLAEAGIPKEKRMILAGHSSEKVQDIYTHLGIGGIKEEVLALFDKLKG